MNTQKALRTNAEQTDNGFIELSDQELLDLIDANARKLLGISGQEFLRRHQEGKPIEDDLGRPVPAWGPIDMLASLLDD